MNDNRNVTNIEIVDDREAVGDSSVFVKNHFFIISGRFGFVKKYFFYYF